MSDERTRAQRVEEANHAVAQVAAATGAALLVAPVSVLLAAARRGSAWAVLAALGIGVTAAIGSFAALMSPPRGQPLSMLGLLLSVNLVAAVARRRGR